MPRWQWGSWPTRSSARGALPEERQKMSREKFDRMADEDLIALIDAQGSLPETREDKAYWNKIGRLNFLSASPLDDYASLENPDAAA